MLNSQDFNILTKMVKNRLENLIVQRANEEKSHPSNEAPNDEVDTLYRLLAKLILLSEKAVANNHTEGETETVRINIIHRARILKTQFGL